VNYWEARREVFGPEKFMLRMTLSEALCDDLVALETCACRLLPHLDTSGRQILLWEPLCHTREGYTSESMVSVVLSRLLSYKMCAVVLLCISLNLISGLVAPRSLVCHRGNCERKRPHRKRCCNDWLGPRLHDMGL
jgi:hypothetical protein